MQPKRKRKVIRYAPGQFAPVTGIYTVHHATAHRATHLITVIRGEVLPPCRFCKAEVQYVLQQQASHVTHDIDFAGPTMLVLTNIQRSA